MLSTFMYYMQIISLPIFHLNLTSSLPSLQVSHEINYISTGRIVTPLKTTEILDIYVKYPMQYCANKYTSYLYKLLWTHT